MNSRERLLTTLDHREPDRIPFDLGSTQVTGIHAVAYRRLRAYLNLPPLEPAMCDAVQQLSAIHNIQADVPPENVVAMWEALREYDA